MGILEIFAADIGFNFSKQCHLQLTSDISSLRKSSWKLTWF